MHLLSRRRQNTNGITSQHVERLDERENCEIERVDQARVEEYGHLERGPPKFSSVTYHSAEMIVFHPLNHVDGTINIEL